MMLSRKHVIYSACPHSIPHNECAVNLPCISKLWIIIIHVTNHCPPPPLSSFLILTGLLASPQSAPGSLENSKHSESRMNGAGGSRENSTVDFSKVSSLYIMTYCKYCWWLSLQERVPKKLHLCNFLINLRTWEQTPLFALMFFLGIETP